ncbi:MAG: phosphotransferase [Deltaproteobacteria bacterium]|nr:phosphotransferase [Deltaproteobacteria bacterium]
MYDRSMVSDFYKILQWYDALDDGEGRVPAAGLAVEPLAGGLINATFALGRRHVLQRLHPIFAPAVNADIASLLPELRAGGVPVPELVASRAGEPGVVVDGEAWRIMTRLPGKTLHRLENAEQARRAGAMIGRFHSAVRGSQHVFAFSRPGAHDTDAHLAKLAAALERQPDHRYHREVAEIASDLAPMWRAWGRPPRLPRRLIHGDLKVSNLLFDGDDVCGVIDLDTMGWSSLDIELGDAMRSWCNPGREDDPQPRFDVEMFAAAMQGYLPVVGSWLQADEVAALVPAVQRIALELAARFAGDALDESYFGWDASRFASRGEHNLVRARNQWQLARQIGLQRAAMERAVAACLPAT